MTPLFVVLGGALGAPSRYLLDLLVQSRHDTRMPWGTFTVNALGSLILGLVAGGVAAHSGPSWLAALVGTGVCGALTTFSTFSFENVSLVENGQWRLAGAYTALSLSVGLALCSLGWWAASSL